MAELPQVDAALVVAAASEFSSYPGSQTDASAKDFLDRFPLPVIFSVLGSGADVPGLETNLVSCLERIFRTKYGSSLIPHYMPFVQTGLCTDSELIRCLVCKAVAYLLENGHMDTETSSQLLIEYDIYPLLVNCLVDGNEQIAIAAMDAITNLAGSPGGIGIIFPPNSDGDMHLKNIAARCSSTAKIRVLALIAKLFSASSSLASTIYNSNLLTLFDAEINNTDDMLMTLSTLELLYELAESPHATKFLLTTKLLQLLASMISNTSVDSALRLRAIMICGRLLSKDDTFAFIDKSSIESIILAIDERLTSLNYEDTDESESALEALGQIGSSNYGAALLLSSSTAARHVVMAGFEQRGRGKQLAALHALANIVGEKRPEEMKMLDNDAEECLRRLMYTIATSSSKLTPSALFLSILRQDSEIRMAAYRAITGLVIRHWCLIEICSKEEIIDIVTDPYIETTKNIMEARHKCCSAIYAALLASNKQNNSISGVAQKLHEAVKRGPYLAKVHMEAQPVVVTAERF